MDTVKYHPILFSTPMVQAIDENRKTQTRRTKGLEKVNENPDDWKFDRYSVDMAFDQIGCIFSNGHEEIHIPFNYNIYDVFWVRESYHRIHDANTDKFLRFGYKADKNYKGAKWKPSIHMPKRACRFFLKIKSIRAERLNEISNEDAIAEGINSEPWALDNEVTLFENYTNYGKPFYSFSQYQWNFGKEEHSAAVASFCTLWEDINGKESWNNNPFVWVYEFEKIEKPEDFGV